MAGRKIFAGARLRALRDQHSLTQAELAARLEISTSYVNQIENNQRPLTAAVMIGLAERFGLDMSELMTDRSDRLLAGLREALGDPVFAGDVPALSELKSVTVSAPDTAHALLRLYASWRQRTERLASVGAGTAYGEGTSRTAWEQVRDFFDRAGNYFDSLDRAAEQLAAEIEPGADAGPHRRLDRLARYFERTHDIRIRFADPERADLIRKFDRAARTLMVNGRLPAASRFFQIAAQLALMEQTTLIGSILEEAELPTDESRGLGRLGLANYFAGALQMPYAAFRAAADALRHDLDELGYRFGASREQVAHRLASLQRPGASGIPFLFARLDPGGTITKRHSATPLEFPRLAGACPLWGIHDAFAAQGRIRPQRAETPDGRRYLALAWSADKPTPPGGTLPRRYAYLLGCEIENADRLVYADGLDFGPDATFDPVGISCPVCERRQCAHRSVPPLADAIEIDPGERGIVPYRIV